MTDLTNLEIDMDLRRICDELKELGVKEVILDYVVRERDGGQLIEPVIEFRGQYGRAAFLIRATNDDFAIQGL